MFDIVEPFPLLSQTKARGWRAMVQKEGRLQAIICAGWTASGGSHTALIGQMNQPGARGVPVALAS
ncbi:MAG: hypothetical protein ACXVH3_12380 [Solirubrobacteraceae bacterium]